MTMGPHGVYWERTQTWWDMVPAYHLYLARCQQLLRQGLPVADILYLVPEGAPTCSCPLNRPLRAICRITWATTSTGCAPDTLIERAAVRDGLITFPDGMSYRVLVMPRFDTMTPRLLRKIGHLVVAGATVIGELPRKSPSLANYPGCDAEVERLSSQLWGASPPAAERTIGKGRLILDAALPPAKPFNLAKPDGFGTPKAFPSPRRPLANATSDAPSISRPRASLIRPRSP